MIRIAVKNAANAVHRPVGSCAESSTVRRLALFFASLALLVVTAIAVSGSVSATPNETDRKAIEYLIEYIRKSDMTFVRNFSKHTSGEAASHIREKYQHFHDNIETPEDFISLCATESLMTSRDYLVIDAQGYEFRSRDWLLQALTDYRKQQSRTAGK